MLVEDCAKRVVNFCSREVWSRQSVMQINLERLSVTGPNATCLDGRDVTVTRRHDSTQ